MDASTLPEWKDMPPVEGQRHGCAWGLFDRDGEKNGHVPPYFDDEISFNTQVGSQWDGLRHWGDSQTGKHYNGIVHEEVLASGKLGIEKWTERGGIAGRGVLLDYVAYAARKGITYSPMSGHAITVSQLDEMARDAGVQFRAGDILLVRSGWTKWYDEHGPEDRSKYVANAYAWVGVESSETTVRWLWNHHFAAVAGDSNGFEVIPPVDKDWQLHDFLLAQWGTPIGEMFDLEALAKECERHKRWTFFFTSAPLHLPGGVASPPNAMCIF